ncbi:MAG TPA: DinB family protein [Chitinophagaceae bacterium]|jgi:uncharacterized damage-inducible protein DinB
MKEQLLATLEKSKHYTLGVITAMPAAAYDFKPTADVWTFGELINHISYGIYWWEENFIKAKKTDWNPPAADSSPKAVLAALNKAYASLESTIKKQSMNDDAVAGFHATLDHITHHRGQATVYLRCKGITPPEYEY